jgi:hypothetical protein
MPVIVGLILTPFGAAIATTIFLIITIAEYAATIDIMILLRTAVEIIPYGLLYGSVFFIPIAAIVLPTAHLILRRYVGLGMITLTVTGLVASLLLMLAIILFEQLDGSDIPFFSRRTLNFSVIGSGAGAIVGLAFAFLTRWWRPFDWPSYWSALQAGPPQPGPSESRLQPGGGDPR